MNDPSKEKKGTFNRCSPLLERKHVPCEVISFGSNKSGTTSTVGVNVASKRRENFTLRVLEGHRKCSESGGLEKAIRLEISDEYRRQCPNKRSIHNEHGISPFSPLRDCRRRDSAISVMNMMPSPSSYPVQSSSKYSKDCIMHWQEEGEYEVDEMVQIDSYPIKLYELEVGESDFAALQKDQALLVDFSNFSKSFINLLSLCDLGLDEMEKSTQENVADENREQHHRDREQCQNFNPLLGCQLSASGGMIGQSSMMPIRTTHSNQSIYCDEGGVGSMYTCRIEEFSNKPQNMNSWNSKNGLNTEKVVRFSIVESNQFRELTHLSLNLLSGTDASVNSYLSLRLSETIGSISMLRYKLHKEADRASTAEKSCNDITSKFNEFVAMTQKEKNILVHEAGETIQKQTAKKDEELKVVKERSDFELQALRSSTAEIHQSLQAEIQRLENLNKQLTSERTTASEENNRLNIIVSELEDKTKNLSGELKKVHGLLDEEKIERNRAECQYKNSQEKLLLLQRSNDEKCSIIHQMEEKNKLSSQKAQKAHDESESCAIRLHATEQELIVIKEEFNKLKELLCKYQSDRQEMKRRMKSKVDLIQKQEEILASKEISATEVMLQLEQSQNDLVKMDSELALLKKELGDANKIIDENKKTLANNQQVRLLTQMFDILVNLANQFSTTCALLLGHRMVEQRFR